MLQFTIHRFIRSLARLFFATVLVFVLVEIAVFSAESQGGSPARHVSGEAFHALIGNAPAGLAPESAEPIPWWRLIGGSSLESLKITGLSLILAIAFQLPLGVLSARFRRIPVLEPFFVPFYFAVWLPGFWISCLLVRWLIETWGQPGFADTAGTSSSAVAGWWEIFLPSALVALSVIGWQIRTISLKIRSGSRPDHIRAALIRGQSGARLFYRHIFRNSLEPLARSLDRSLPVMFGTQFFVEWAFHWPGLGRLLIDSARDGHFTGLLGGSLVIVFLMVGFRFAGEVLHGSIDRRARDEISAGAFN